MSRTLKSDEYEVEGTVQKHLSDEVTQTPIGSKEWIPLPVVLAQLGLKSKKVTISIVAGSLLVVDSATRSEVSFPKNTWRQRRLN